jgi:hypothetical protein
MDAFFCRDFTFVCPTEILAFNDALVQFKELGTAVLGISLYVSIEEGVLFTVGYSLYRDLHGFEILALRMVFPAP